MESLFSKVKLIELSVPDVDEKLSLDIVNGCTNFNIKQSVMQF